MVQGTDTTRNSVHLIHCHHVCKYLFKEMIFFLNLTENITDSITLRILLVHFSFFFNKVEIYVIIFNCRNVK